MMTHALNSPLGTSPKAPGNLRGRQSKERDGICPEQEEAKVSKKPQTTKKQNNHQSPEETPLMDNPNGLFFYVRELKKKYAPKPP